MKWLKDAWNWLDGKKTAIGSTLLVVAQVLPPHTTVHKVSLVLGTLLTGTGVVHKAKKGELNRGRNINK
jgi:hypothetical protein